MSLLTKAWSYVNLYNKPKYTTQREFLNFQPTDRHKNV